MHRSRLAASIAVVMLAFAACGSGSATVDDAAAGAQSDALPDLIVVPDEAGRFTAATVVQCGQSPPFLASALDSPVLLADSTVTDGSLDVLENFMSEGEGDWWPQDGYWVLTNTETELLLAHIGTASEVTLIGSELTGGSWRATAIQSGGPCPIQVPLPDGVHEVEWRIDPAYPIEETSTTISLLATGQACSGGQPMGERLRPAETLLTQDTVFLVLVADMPSGDQNCPGNPEEPVAVDLGEAIGSRSIVNARVVAGSLPDYLPVSPCGHLTTPNGPVSDDEPVALDGPPERTQCE